MSGIKEEEYTFLVGKSGITCFNGDTRIGIIPRDSVNKYHAILAAIKTGDYKKASTYFISDKHKKAKSQLKLPKGFTLSEKNRTLSYNKHVWPHMYELSHAVEGNTNWNKYFPKFLKKLTKLRRRDRDMLTDFLNKNHELLSFDKEGNLLLWKRVKDDLTSFHLDENGNPIENKIGCVTRMPREKVTHDPKEACAPGLHVCALKYLDYFHPESGCLLLCKVNPRDVVSVPEDSKQTKLRVCEYTPVLSLDSGELAVALQKTISLKKLGDDYIKDLFDLLGQNNRVSIYTMAEKLGMGRSTALNVAINLSKFAGMRLEVPAEWDGKSFAGVKLIKEY